MACLPRTLMAETFSPSNIPESSPSTKWFRASAFLVLLEFIIAKTSRSASTLPMLRNKDAFLLLLVFKQGEYKMWTACSAVSSYSIKFQWVHIPSGANIQQGGYRQKKTISLLVQYTSPITCHNEVISSEKGTAIGQTKMKEVMLSAWSSSCKVLKMLGLWRHGDVDGRVVWTYLNLKTLMSKIFKTVDLL